MSKASVSTGVRELIDTGMWIAVMADTGATVLVTLNAMRLLGYRFSPGTAPTSQQHGTAAA